MHKHKIYVTGIKTRSHGYLLFNCWNIYPVLKYCYTYTKAHILLIALWSIAAIGTLFKLVFIHRFQKISLLAYVLMGWLAVFVMDDMRTYLSKDTLMLLITGGLAYTVGALFYALKR